MFVDKAYVLASRISNCWLLNSFRNISLCVTSRILDLGFGPYLSDIRNIGFADLGPLHHHIFYYC